MSHYESAAHVAMLPGTYQLASVGSPISLQEHIDAILEGLPQDYLSVISVIESKFHPLPIEEVEALLPSPSLALPTRSW